MVLFLLSAPSRGESRARERRRFRWNRTGEVSGRGRRRRPVEASVCARPGAYICCARAPCEGPGGCRAGASTGTSFNETVRGLLVLLNDELVVSRCQRAGLKPRGWVKPSSTVVRPRSPRSITASRRAESRLTGTTRSALMTHCGVVSTHGGEGLGLQPPPVKEGSPPRWDPGSPTVIHRGHRAMKRGSKGEMRYEDRKCTLRKGWFGSSASR